LLKYKKKPNNFYLIAFGYYLLIFVLVCVSSQLLNSLEAALWTAKAARTYRDISLVIHIPQYIFILILATRSLGFNIKQFNFQDDVKELELADEDSEEIEINIGFEKYKTKRWLRRSVREFRYYFLENKFIIICLGVILVVLSVYFGFTNFEKKTYNYKQGDTFIFNSLNFKIEDSIITNLNYAGEVLNNKKYYLLLKVTITNNTMQDIKFNYSKILLYSHDSHYTPTLDVGSNFVDYAIPFIGESIKAKTSKTYLIPYTIPKEEIKDNFRINIYTGYSLKEKIFHPKSINIELSPIQISNVAIVSNTDINNPIEFSNTYLDKTILNIKNIQITNKYEYDYESCTKNECRKFKDFITADFALSARRTLMVMDYDFMLDNQTPYYNKNQTIYTFAEDFFKVRYIYNDSVYVTSIKNVTPKKLKNKLILETTADIAHASKVELIVTIRNKSFIINLV